MNIDLKGLKPQVSIGKRKEAIAYAKLYKKDDIKKSTAILNGDLCDLCFLFVLRFLLLDFLPLFFDCFLPPPVVLYKRIFLKLPLVLLLLCEFVFEHPLLSNPITWL